MELTPEPIGNLPAAFHLLARSKHKVHFRPGRAAYAGLPGMITILVGLASMLLLLGCSGGGGDGDAPPPQPPPVIAPAIAWSPAVTGLPGAAVRDLAVDPADFNRVLAATAGGVYRTTDGGVSWDPVLRDRVILQADAVAIDPFISSTMYAAESGAGVLKSVDSGATWAAANTGLSDPDVRVLMADPATAGTLYAGTATNIFKTTTGGSSWSALNPPQAGKPVTAMAIDPSNANTLYAATEVAGVLKSTDGGATWLSSNSGLVSLHVYSIAVDPITPSTVYAGISGFTNLIPVYKSTDSGASWVPTAWLGNMTITALAVDPATPGTVYAGASVFGGQVYKSTDGGGTWGSGTGPQYGGDCLEIVLNPNAPARIYIGFQGRLSSGIVNSAAVNGVFLSTDGGGTWASRNDGMTNVSVAALLVDSADSSKVYAGTERQYLGFHSSNDGGANWVGRRGLASTATILSLASDPVSPAVTYAAGAGRSSNVFTVSGNDLSSLCGFDCIGFQEGLVNTIVAAVAQPVSILYFGTDNGLFKSTDRAVSWSNASSGLTDTRVRALSVDPDVPATLYAGTPSGVFKSVNAAASWSLSLDLSGINALAIDPSDPDIIYAGSDSGVYRSQDAGGSWSASNTGLTSPKVQAIAIDPGQPAMVYVGTPGGVFRSLDRGARWAEENDGLYVRDVRAIAIDPVTPSTIYAGTTGGGVFKTE